MKLNDEQRSFVETNHNLIYSFLNTYNLDVEMHYDLAAIGLCKAGATYNDSLRKFSTYAYQCMWNVVFTYIRRQRMKKRIPEQSIVYYQNELNDKSGDSYEFLNFIASSVNVEDEVLNKVIFEDVVKGLNDKERKILKLLASGFTQSHIGSIVGCSQAEVSRVKNKIRKGTDEALAKSN